MSRDWKELSEAASREQDPKKLMELVEQLDKLLEECENSVKEKPSGQGSQGSNVISAMRNSRPPVFAA